MSQCLCPRHWTLPSPCYLVSLPSILKDVLRKQSLCNFRLSLPCSSPQSKPPWVGTSTRVSISCVQLSPQLHFCSLPLFGLLFYPLVYQMTFRLPVASAVPSPVEECRRSGQIQSELPENGVHLFSKSVVEGVPFFTQNFHLVTINPFLCIRSSNRGSNQNCSCYTVFQLLNFYKSLYPRGNSRGN